MAIVIGTGLTRSLIPGTEAIPDITRRTALTNITAIAAWDNSSGWWKKCRHTSWWQEVGKPPMLAYVVATDSVVNIYDVQDMSLWMSFTQASGQYTLINPNNAGISISSVATYDNRIVLGKDTAFGGVVWIDFKKDSASFIHESVYLQNYTNIEDRNVNMGSTPPTSSTSTVLVNSTVNSVDIVEINGSYFIAVGSDSGVSIVKLHPDGRVDTSYGTSGVVDITQNSWTTNFCIDCKLGTDGSVYIASSADWSSTRAVKVFRVDLPESDITNLNSIYTFRWQVGETPALWHEGSSAGDKYIYDVKDYENLFIGHDDGITVAEKLLGDETNGMVQYVSKDYITPPMKGDVRGAYVPALTDTSFTQNSEGAVPDRSASNMDLTPKGGNVSTANFGNGAAKAFTFDGTNYLTQETFDSEQNELSFRHDDLSDFRIQTTSITDGATEDTVTVAANGDVLFADGDRVVVYDETGYKVEGVVDGTPSATSILVDDGAGGDPGVTEKVGVSLDLDGTYNATAANNTIHDITTQDIGIAAWVNIDSNSGASGYIISKRSSGLGYTFLVKNTGVLEAYINDGTNSYDMTGNTDIRGMGWVHVAGIIDRDNAANCKIYLNGYEDGTTNKSGTVTSVGSLTNSLIFALGSRSDGNNKFDGQIRDVLIAYPADIMAAGELGASGEILTLATTPRDSTTVNHEDFWECSENTGTTITGTVNNLTLSNAAAWDQLAYISRNLLSDPGLENGGIGAWTKGSTNDTFKKVTDIVKKDSQSLYLAAASGASNPSYYQQVSVGGSETYLVRCWADKNNAEHGGVAVAGDAGFTYTYIRGNEIGWTLHESIIFTEPTQTYIRVLPNLYDSSMTGQDARIDDLVLLKSLLRNGGMWGTWNINTRDALDTGTGGSITNGGTTLTEVGAFTGDNWVGGYVRLDPGGANQEDHLITSHTDDALTIEGTWSAPTGTYSWEVRGAQPDGWDTTYSSTHNAYFRSSSQPNIQYPTSMKYSIRIQDKIYSDQITVSQNRWYEISFWGKGATGSETVQVGDPSAAPASDKFPVTFSLTSSWSRYSIVFKQPASPDFQTAFTPSGGDVYLDDIAMIPRPDLDATVTALDSDSLWVPARQNKGVYMRGGATLAYTGLIANPSEFGFVARIIPQFDGGVHTDGEDKVVFIMYKDSSNYFELWYDANQGKWTFTKNAAASGQAATSAVQSFDAGTPLELSGSFNTTDGMKLYVNGILEGSNSDTTTPTGDLTLLDVGVYGTLSQVNCIIDELALFVKSPTEADLLDIYRLQKPITNTNRLFKYTGSLDIGDILTVNGEEKKRIITAKLYDASTGTESSVLANSTILNSHAPWLDADDEMLYFPTALSGGVEIVYRKDWL